MDCREIRELIDEYITGELSREKAEAVKEHLAFCDDCKREYAELKALKTELAALKEEPPAELREKLIKRLKSEKRRHIFAGLGLMSTAAAAVALICIIGVGNNGGYSGITEDRIKTAGVEQVQEAANEDTDAGFEEAENSPEAPEATQAVTAEKQTEQQSAVTEEKAQAAVTESNGAEIRQSAAEETTRAEVQKAAAEDNTAVEEEQETPRDNSVPSSSSSPSLGLSPSSSSDFEFDGEESTPLMEDDSLDYKKSAPLMEDDSLDYEESVDEAPAMDVPKSVEPEINSVIGDSAPAETAPQLRASGAATPASINNEIRFTLNEGDKEALKEKISSLKQAENISFTEKEITFRINGLAYSELKAELKDFDLTSENTLSEDTTDYNVRISFK